MILSKRSDKFSRFFKNSILLQFLSFYVPIYLSESEIANKEIPKDSKSVSIWAASAWTAVDFAKIPATNSPTTKTNVKIEAIMSRFFPRSFLWLWPWLEHLLSGSFSILLSFSKSVCFNSCKVVEVSVSFSKSFYWKNKLFFLRFFLYLVGVILHFCKIKISLFLTVKTYSRKMFFVSLKGRFSHSQQEVDFADWGQLRKIFLFLLNLAVFEQLREKLRSCAYLHFC